MSESVNYKHVSEVDIVSELLGSDTQQLERNGDFQRIKGEKIGTKAEVNQLKDSISANKQSIDAQATSINQLQQTTNTHGLNIQMNEVEIGKQSNEQDVSSPAVTATSYGSLQIYSDSANKPIVGLTLYGKTTQEGTPSPDNPAELVNIGTKGNIGLMVRGKNLIPYPYTEQTKTVSGITFTVNADGSVKVSGTSTAMYATLFVTEDLRLPKGNFKMAKSANITFAINRYVRSTGAYSAFIASAGGKFDTSGWNYDEYRYSVIVQVVESGKTVSDIVYPMITYDTIDEDYEPFRDGGSMTVSTPNGLPGIPVTSGGNYTDEDGQQWICDEVDFGRGVYVKRVNSYAFTGGESWVSQSTPGGYRARLVGVIVDYKKLAANREAVNALCTHYAVVDAESTYLGTQNGVALEMNGTSVTAYDTSKTAEDVNVWKTYLAEQNAAGTPLSLLYQLATPIETALSAEELAAYAAMTSQYPNTTIINDEGAGMKVTYVVDTSHHVEQQMEAAIEASSPPMILSESGSVITVNDSAHRKLTGLKLYGKTTQAQTTGKNLLRSTATSRTVNGVTFTVNADGTITINGTATENTWFAINTDMGLQPGDYILSGNTGGEKNKYFLYVSINGNNKECLNSEVGFTVADGDTNTAYFVVYAGVTLNNHKVYPMIRLASVTDATYEPYSGGYASPSPNWAQPLINVGAGSDISVKVRGKNLLKNIATNSGYNGITFTVTGDGGIKVTGTASALTTLTITERDFLSAGKYLMLPSRFGRTYVDVIAGGAQVVQSQVEQVMSFTIKEGDNAYARIVVPEGETVEAVIYPAVYRASTADLTYEPYKDGGNATFNTPNGLPGIPVNSGGNYTDDNGQQWTCDEVDFARGVYVQRVGRKLLDKNVNYGYSEGGGKPFISFSLPGAVMTGAYAQQIGLCNRMPFYTYANASAQDVVISSLSTTSTNYGITVAPLGVTSVEEWLAFIDTRDIEILYQLAEPVETPLPSDVLKAFNTLTSQYPATTVFNDAGVGMSISYVADIKSYIDQRIAELTAALLSTGANV